MNRDKNSKYGFTLVELMLAMGFVSALLLAIAMTVMQISNIFGRGLTFKNVNQVGLAISSGLQTDINNSSPFSLTAAGVDARYINNPYVGGRLCLGGYTYVWNYGNAINGSYSGLNMYTSNLNNTRVIRFAKVPDPNNKYCKTPTVAIDATNATELLNPGEYNLAVHSFTIASPATAADTRTSQQLYSITILVGTNNLINNKSAIDANNKCYLPNSPQYDSMCYVNDFNIVVRAGNTVQ